MLNMKLTLKQQKTADSYNINARKHEGKFNLLGIRKKDIDLAFALNQSGSKDVLEIGCGTGRDATYIAELSSSYLGIDTSKELLEIAKKHVSEETFLLQNILEYEAKPHSYGVIFAFASVLHLKKSELRKLLGKVALWLKGGGVIYISTMKGDYQEFEKPDGRIMYLYSFDDLMDLLSNNFEIVYKKTKKVHDSQWLEIVLRKVSYET
jgi:SAM-dependent methyltransferase